MKSRFFLPVALGFSVIFCACNKENTGSPIPEISNLEQSARQISIRIGSEDTLAFRFSFKDGDADINGGAAKVVFTNLLDTAAQPDSYPFPEINAQLDPNKGITGRALVTFDATATLFQMTDTTREREMRLYEVYMMDDAGNKSNVLTTDSVEILN